MARGHLRCHTSLQQGELPSWGQTAAPSSSGGKLLRERGPGLSLPREDKTHQKTKEFWQNVFEVAKTTGSAEGAAWLPEEHGGKGMLTTAKLGTSSAQKAQLTTRLIFAIKARFEKQLLISI